MKFQKKTALLIVDMQNYATKPGPFTYETTIRMMEDGFGEKVDRMRDNGCLIVHVWSDGDGNGLTARPHKINPELSGRNMESVEYPPECNSDIDERIHVLPEDVVLKKFTYSAFWGTPLLEILQQQGVENVLVCGEKVNVCCRMTAIDAVSHCFKTFIVEDMISTNNDEIKAFHLDEFDRYFAKVLSSEEVIRRLEIGEF